RLAPGKVADESGLGDLDSRAPLADRELRRVVVFPGTRMQIEEEPPEQAIPLHYFVRFHARIPDDRAVDPPVGHAEELRSHVQDALLHPIEGEVRADVLRV